jgi:regulator of sigma E protease
MDALIWIFYKIFVPVCILGAAINIHEFGHFIVARFFKMRVEAYSFFGLGPRIWGFKRGNTDYRISAIPLGAYVKLYGDEGTSALEGGSSVGDVPKEELYELRPRWQKFFVMLGGPFMNIVLALAIPFGMAVSSGVPKVPEPIIGVINAGGVAEQSGLKVGDKIVAFGGTESPNSNRIRIDAAINPEKSMPITVERAGQRVNLQIVPKKVSILGGQEVGDLEMEPFEPVLVGVVQPNTPAQEAGLLADDKILKVNQVEAQNFLQVRDLVQKFKTEPIRLTIERSGKIQDLTAVVRKLEDGTERLGFAPKKLLEPASLATAISYAFSFNFENLRATVSVLGQVFSGQRSAKDAGISGPVGIFKQSSEFAQAMGWEGAFVILAGISLSLGVMNLLPIPMLDGGQIMMLGVEKVYSWFGKTLSMVIRERVQLAGLAMILLLMVFVFFLDFSRMFSDTKKVEQPAANAVQK